MWAPLNHNLFIREASPGLGGVCLGQATVHIRLPTCLVANKLMSSEAPAWPRLGLEPLSCDLGIFISAQIETGVGKG